MPAKLITPTDVELALRHVETGMTTVDDANTIRAYIAQLKNIAVLESDSDMDADTEWALGIHCWRGRVTKYRKEQK